MQKFYFRKPVSVYSQRFSPFSDFAFAIFELFFRFDGVSQQNLLSNSWQRVDKLARKRTKLRKQAIWLDILSVDGALSRFFVC
jgi:hypothetical protein